MRTATAPPWLASSPPRPITASGIAGIGFAGVRVMPVTVLGADGTRPGQRHHLRRRLGRRSRRRRRPHGLQQLRLLACPAGRDRLRLVARRGPRCRDGQRRLDGGILPGRRSWRHRRRVDDLVGHGRRVLEHRRERLHGRPRRGHRHDRARWWSCLCVRHLGSCRRGRRVRRAAPRPGSCCLERRDRWPAGPERGSRRRPLSTGNGRLNLARAAADASTEAVQPAGAAPLGSGGPFVGPYTSAQTNFQNLAVGAQSPNPVLPGNSATYSVTVSYSGNGACTVGGFTVTSALPAGVSASFSPTSVSRTNTGDQTVTMTLSTSGSTPAGTTSLTVSATGTSGDCNNTRPATGSLVVSAPSNTPSGHQSHQRDRRRFRKVRQRPTRARGLT